MLQIGIVVPTRLTLVRLSIRRSNMVLEELKPGLRIEGLIPAEVITVIYAQWHGSDALELTYKTTAGSLGQQVVFPEGPGQAQHRADRQPCVRRTSFRLQAGRRGQEDHPGRVVRPDAGRRYQ